MSTNYQNVKREKIMKMMLRGWGGRGGGVTYFVVSGESVLSLTEV